MKPTKDVLVTICIPHWQVKKFSVPCLRLIRKHSQKYPIEVIVIDNGSKDGESLEYLRSLKWIKLIERPDESVKNWPDNIFEGWDMACREAKGKYFMTMHTDVFVKSDNWLDPFINAMESDDNIAAVGGWKLNLENPIYAFQKHFFGYLIRVIRGQETKTSSSYGYFPRDYCALYRRDAILKNNLSFAKKDKFTGGFPIISQLWKCGYKHHLIPVRELYKLIAHVAHGTAGLVKDKKPLRHKRAQNKAERRVEAFFKEKWMKEIYQQPEWDK